MTKKQTNSILSLTNIGKVTARKLEAIGIVTKEQFLSLDPYEVFLRLKLEVDPTLCRCALASIVGASVGVAWPKLHKEAAKEWERRFPEMPWNCRC